MNSQCVVGIDVGGQTTKIGVVDSMGTVLAQYATTVVHATAVRQDVSRLMLLQQV